jgi:hypothetical protein
LGDRFIVPERWVKQVHKAKKRNKGVHEPPIPLWDRKDKLLPSFRRQDTPEIPKCVEDRIQGFSRAPGVPEDPGNPKEEIRKKSERNPKNDKALTQLNP